MPFCHGSIVAPRPAHPHRWKFTQAVTNAPKTIGDHLKTKRLQLHLFQSDIANTIGISTGSLQNWERNVGTPMPKNMPAVIRFLGYVPFEHDGSLGGKTRWLRLGAGWNQEELAVAARCEESTVWRWVSNRPFAKYLWQRGVASLRRRLARLGLFRIGRRRFYRSPKPIVARGVWPRRESARKCQQAVGPLAGSLAGECACRFFSAALWRHP